MKIKLLTLILLLSGSVGAQQPLTADQIFSLRRTDAPAEVVKWLDDNSFVLARRTDGQRNCFTVKIKTREVLPLSDDELKSLIPEKRSKLKQRDGDIIVEDEVLIKGDNRNQELSPDGNYVAYTRDNDLYTLRLSDKKEFRITNDGSDVILNGYASWVYMEEILGRATRYKAYWWSPDSKTLAFFRFDDSEVPLFTTIDSPGQYGRTELLRYPKPGAKNPEVKTGFADPEGKNIVWADFAPDDDQYFGKPCWLPSGVGIRMQWLNRDQNNYKIYDVDIRTGQKKEVYNETQKAWINLDKDDIITFLSDGRSIISSDKSGYYHLYMYAADGSFTNAITAGSFSVLDIVRIDEKTKTVYFTCHKDNLACIDFYKASFDGKQLKRLSFGDYTHQISLSPGAKYFTTRYSNAATPPRLDLYSVKGEFIMSLDDARNPENEIYDWAQTKFVSVKSADGRYDLPMMLTLPVNMEKDRKYPVLVEVYGGPGANNVYQGWRNLSPMKNWYAREGLIQVALDHRGSSWAGKRGQEEMYRKLGETEVNDYATCVKWLIENAQADPERVCITGFSYGGYISAYALAYAPDVFTHGIAGGSVTDWALYDAPYTERYMDTPEDNPDGYKQASVLTHADKIKGKLLLTHGLIDENVHAQNTFQLISVLEDAGKDFELMIYPSSRHGYGGPKGVHFRNLQIRFVYKYLLQKQIPDIVKEKMEID